METITKKNDNTTPVDRAGLGLTLTSANQNKYPVAYDDDVWAIVLSGSSMSVVLSGVTSSGSTGTYTEGEITEGIAQSIVNLTDKVDYALTSGGTVEQKITTAINTLDSSKTSTTSSNFKVTLTQTDGKISDLSLTGPGFASSTQITNLF